ncbi:unnamed protein product [Anisakis simplex]|uniref:APH domain-containing protein n=1 Tax=Anisakis simplex TaxID=6269 RepID=A0A0M3IYG7_ANISI|nr:unnamed protein product [Anisakis simplex]
MGHTNTSQMSYFYFQILSEYLTADYLENVMSGNWEEEYGVGRVLVHGQPTALNLFIQSDDKLSAIVDWSEAHPGCFGEDIAAAICWNLSPVERHANHERLLEFYHYNLIKHSAGSFLQLLLLNIIPTNYKPLD